LLGIGADAVESKQHDQGGEPGIHRPQIWIFSVHLAPESFIKPSMGGRGLTGGTD
jgi:hypothetical protein